MLESANVSAPAPALANGVRLAGEMPDVGFRERQWLVERNGHFIQVTELLYRVLEQIDGVRTAAEIAAAVTEHSHWSLEPAQVEYLLAVKLRPQRLVLDPAAPSSSSPSPSVDSPLRLAMRMRMLPPSLVGPFANGLRHLYAPPALAAICLAIALAHWWLYATHSVTAGLAAAFYAPGGLLAVLALGVAAGLFHELGHAAALRYGGGRSRGIGMGIYLMFPAFYSDVTDSYRLPRAARIRTDLGGIYFHLIFSVALIGLSAAFDSQFLLAAVLVFNLEALRQLMPLARLDGYWLLADLTGIPDFFSQMRAFAGSALPEHKRTGDVLPALKPWVAAMFAVYIVTAIPAMIWLLVLTVLYVPDLVVLTREAFARQLQLLSAAQGIDTQVLAASQIVLMPLPLLATTYFLYRLAIAAVRAAIREEQAALVSRLAGPAFAALALAALGSLFVQPGSFKPSWAISATAAKPHHPSPETRALELLRSAEQAVAAVESIEAEFRGVISDEAFRGRMSLRRPNHARVDVSGSESVGSFNVASDGSTLFVYFPSANRFTKTKTTDDGRNIDAFIVDPVRIFFQPAVLRPAAGETAAYKGSRQVGGRTFDVVQLDARGRRPTSVAYYISAADGLVHRVEVTTWRNGKPSMRSVELDRVRLDADADAALFRFAPPRNAVPLDLATLGVQLP